MLALSVSISTSGSPFFTSPPSSTSHLRIVPSSIESDRRGMVTSVATARDSSTRPGPALPRTVPRTMRLLAAVAVHNEMRWLPGFVENVAPRTDGIVAFDDASTDGSGEFLAEHPGVLEVVRSDAPHPDERDRFRILLDVLARHEPGWVIGLDADERLERDFRSRAERVMRRARL